LISNDNMYLVVFDNIDCIGTTNCRKHFIL
jgi:hypothetical protein